jgi:hypothetical protein
MKNNGIIIFYRYFNFFIFNFKIEYFFALDIV